MIPEILSFGDKGFGDELLWGALNTLFIAFFAFVVGLVLGLLGASAKLYGGVVTRTIANVYTTVVRAVPELVLILLLFFAGTRGINYMLAYFGMGPIGINQTLAAIKVLGFVQGAYHTEVFRGAIQAIPRGQIEAARAYGMGHWLMLRRIIIPAMIPNAIPGLANLWLIVIKDTALIAVVGGSPELAQVSQSAAAFTKRYNLFLLTAGAMYLTMTLVSSYFIGKVEAHFRRGQQKLS